jgi:hypothetical protein
VAALLLLGVGVYFIFVGPWLKLGREVNAELAKLSQALEERRKPEQEALKALAEAESLSREGKFRACARICDEIEEAYGGLQGQPPPAGWSPRATSPRCDGYPLYRLARER